MDYAQLRSLTARKIIHALKLDGFTFRRQKGSHRRYGHNDGRRVTVSFHHPSDTFPLPTMKEEHHRGPSSLDGGRPPTPWSSPLNETSSDTTSELFSCSPTTKLYDRRGYNPEKSAAFFAGY